MPASTHWAEVVRQVEIGRRFIARQRDIIDHRKSVGLCTISSEGVLASFETKQALLENELAELRGLRSVQRPVKPAHARQAEASGFTPTFLRSLFGKPGPLTRKRGAISRSLIPPPAGR